ncbi:MAG: hypothetical protein FJZ66_09665 [Bacteroidetes bacterium]|nr:hypothetical protein [Bacteroidota bacterium]
MNVNITLNLALAKSINDKLFIKFTTLPKLMRICVLVMFLHTLNVCHSQPWKFIKNADKYDYMFGASWLTSGYVLSKEFAKPFQNIGASGRLFFDIHLYDPWSLETAVTYEQIALFPQILDTNVVFDSISRYNLDVLSKYSFGNLLNSRVIEPYAMLGGGVSQHQGFSANMNMGLGINLWLANSFGIQVQSMIKLPASINFVKLSYLQSTVGLVYRFLTSSAPKSRFSRKRYNLKISPNRIRIRRGRES